MENNEKKSIKKRVLIPIIVIAVLLVLFLIGVWLINRYYGMLNIQKRNNSQTIAESIEESIDPEASNSPEEQISALEQNILANWESHKDDVAIDGDVYNLLIVGIDSREIDDYGRSDTMMILSVNKATKKMTLTSLMRDMYVYIPGVGSNRINAAYAYGGAELLINTIEQNFGITIDNYVTTNFYSFKEAADLVGGVDIEISEEERVLINAFVEEYNRIYEDDVEMDHLPEGATGMQHLNGKQALSYCRIRYVGDGDFDRTERQREVLVQMMKKAVTLNILQLNELAETIFPMLYTDLTLNQSLSLIFNALTTYKSYDVQTFRIPEDGTWEEVTINGMAVLGVNIDQNKEDFFDLVYGK